MMNLKIASLSLTFALTAFGAQAEAFRILTTSSDVPLVPNSVLHLAQSEGYFTRAGVEVELIAVEQTPMAIAALNTGGAEMANISVDGLFGLYIGGLDDLKAVGSTDKAIPYIIAARQGLSLEELTGKRFGIGKAHSLDHNLSWAVLQETTLVPETLDLVPLGQPALRAQALAAGRIDATTLSIGVFAALPERDDLQILIDAESYFKAAPIVSKVNVVSKEIITSRGDDLDRVLEALILAARDYAANPVLWAQAMGRARPDVAPEVLAELSLAYRGNWSVNGGLQLNELNFTHDWLYRTEKYHEKDSVLPGAWIDFAPMDRVLAKIGPSDLGDAISR